MYIGPKLKIMMTTPNDGENVGKLDHRYIAGGSIKWYSQSRRDFELKMQLPFNPSIAFLDLYP